MRWWIETVVRLCYLISILCIPVSLVLHYENIMIRKVLHGTSLGSLAVAVADLRTPSFPRVAFFPIPGGTSGVMPRFWVFLRDAWRRDAFAQLGKDLIATPPSVDSSTSNPFTSNLNATS